MSARRWLTAALATAAVLVPATAHAELPIYGSLVPVGCVVDTVAADAKGCTKAPGIRAAAYTASSPDGRFVYVSSRGSGSLAVFARDRTTGLLTKKSCVASVNTAAELKCTLAPGLIVPAGISIPLDGKNLYVAASNANALVTFARNVKTGKLTPMGCFATGVVAEPSCAQVPRLSAPIGVATSPDGRNVYVTSYDGALLTFNRAANGTLTFAGCMQSSGFDGCVKTPFSFLRWLVVSPDGANVYAADASNNAVHALARDGATGALTWLACWSGLSDGRGRNPVCAAARGVNYPEHVAIAPDGAHVYLTGNANSIGIFVRDPGTGLLTQPPGVDGCITDDVEPGDDCQTSNGLDTTFGLAFDPFGVNLYTGSYGSGSVGMFDRDRTTGQLRRHAPCFSHSDPICTRRTPMQHAGHVMVTPDGRNVYVAAPDSDAVQIFGRAAAAPVVQPRARTLVLKKGKGTMQLPCPKDALLGCYGSVQLRVIDGAGKLVGKGTTVRFDVPARKIAKLKFTLNAASKAALKATLHDVIQLDITSQAPGNEQIAYPRWMSVRGAG